MSRSHFSHRFAFFFLLYSLYTLRSLGCHEASPPLLGWVELLYLLEEKRIQLLAISHFSGYWQKVKITVTVCLCLIQKYGRATRMNSCVGEREGTCLNRQTGGRIQLFLKRFISGSYSPGNLSFLLHKKIHPNNSFEKKKEFMAFFFFSRCW